MTQIWGNIHVLRSFWTISWFFNPYIVSSPSGTQLQLLDCRDWPMASAQREPFILAANIDTTVNLYHARDMSKLSPD